MPEPAALLVVHRDPSVHKIVREALAGEEWRIDSAHDTAEAVSRLQSAPYDLVLAGMSFPGEDCVPLVSRVREMQPAAKIVLTSGGAEPAQIMRLLRAGVTCCVREPLSPVPLK